MFKKISSAFNRSARRPEIHHFRTDVARIAPFSLPENACGLNIQPETYDNISDIPHRDSNISLNSDNDDEDFLTSNAEFSTERYLQCKKQGFEKEKLQLYKLLIFGPPGVGKSSLLQVLVGENPSDVRNSTGVLNVVQVQVKIAITKQSSWHLFSRKEEIARLRGVIKTQFENRYKWNTFFTEHDDTLMSVERTIVQDTTSISDKYVETILICYDSGGHLEFFDVMPALSTLPTGNIMVFDMEKGLGSCTVDGFYIDGECHSSQGQDQFDCTTLLQTAVATIQSLTKRKVSNASATSSHNLLVVGTHLDKCVEKQKTLKCLDKKFYEDVLSKDTCMVKTRQRGQNSLIIHPISNTDASTERDKIAQEIRTAIEEMSKDEIDYSEIQVGWHLFQLEIQETQKSYIGRSEYLHIARSCNMSEDDTPKALQFFHELGILFYYKAAVDVVFCYPQWLFDRLTDLIVQKYRPNSYDIEENMKKGKFSIQDLDTIYKEHIYHDGPLKLEDLLNIFVHHNIMACLPNSNEYFMPALLKPSPASFSLSQLCGEQIGSTLFVQFENTYVPRGVFCCLVVNLAQEDWLVNENNSYKDLIIFQIASNQQVVLFDKIKYIGLKMYVKEDKTLKTNHFDICKTFDLKLKNICSQMRIDWNFKFGFPCKNSDCSDIVCIDFHFPCSLETKCNNCFKRNSLDYDHLVWLFPPQFTDGLKLQPLPISHEQQVQSASKEAAAAHLPASDSLKKSKVSLTSEPIMADLNKIVIPKIKSEWEDVAFALLYDISTVNAILEKHKEDPKKCCRELLMDWLSTDHGVSPKNWSVLLEKIREVENLTKAAEQIEEKLDIVP